MGHWNPPVTVVGIPEEVEEWLLAGSCVTLATIGPNGQPQLSVVWALVEDGALHMATVAGRQKHLNLQADSRATVLVSPPASDDSYVEMRGLACLEDVGGRALIDRLYGRYRGGARYPWDGPDDVRLVVRFEPRHSTVFRG